MDRWFSERGPGMGQEFKITAELCNLDTEFQHIQIFETATHGKLLALDGIIQLTEADEFAYHEMLVHSPLMLHPAPENILIIGGGDGGAVREAARHKYIKNIYWCEIDPVVVDCCEKFLPVLSASNKDPRVKLTIGDGAKFVKEHKSEFDVIIVDSTDPGGAAEPLFGKEFYHDCHAALRTGGIISAQGESPFLLPEVVKSLWNIAGSAFANRIYSFFHVPTYPTGGIGACIASDAPVTQPVRRPDAELQQQLRYYTPEVHKACTVMPLFVQQLLEGGS